MLRKWLNNPEWFVKWLALGFWMYQYVQCKIVFLSRITVNGSSGERVSSPRITAIKAASAMSSLNIQSGPCSPSSNPGTSMVTAAGGPPPGGSLINGVNLSTSSLPGTSTASQGSPSQVSNFYRFIPEVRKGFKLTGVEIHQTFFSFEHLSCFTCFTSFNLSSFKVTFFSSLEHPSIFQRFQIACKSISKNDFNLSSAHLGTFGHPWRAFDTPQQCHFACLTGRFAKQMYPNLCQMPEASLDFFCR